MFRLSRIIPVAAALVLGSAFAPSLVTTAHAQVAVARNQSVMVHLGAFTNDLHSAKMALGVATAMRAQGATVVLFVDREGVRLVDNRQPLTMEYGGGETFDKMYSAFIAAGGEVLVCPHCAAEAGITAAQLRRGAKMAANSAELAKAILAADRVIDF